MLGAAWLNVGSLLFGLAAWILPVGMLLSLYTAPGQARRIAPPIVLSLASITACAVALILQMFYTWHLVKIEDWSALMDTSFATAVVSTFLLSVTLLLNASAWVILWHKERKLEHRDRSLGQ